MKIASKMYKQKDFIASQRFFIAHLQKIFALKKTLFRASTGNDQKSIAKERCRFPFNPEWA